MFDVISAPRSVAPSPASTGSIGETLDEGKRASLDYQILRRTLMIDKDEAPAGPDSAAAAPSEPAAVNTQVSDFQKLPPQNQLELNSSPTPDPQQPAPLVLDTAGNGFSPSGLSRSVRFDLDAD